MTDNFIVQIHPSPEYTLVKPIGAGNIDAAEILRTRLGEVQDANPARVIIDMSQMPYLSSLVVGTFMAFLEKRNRAKGVTRFITLQPEVERLVGIAKLDRHFHIYPDLQSALND